jgi:cilia- and flagella-associated protein 65
MFKVKANGVHPIMAITDIRSENSSKTVLWQLFSLDRFNELLKTPSENELAFVCVN